MRERNWFHVVGFALFGLWMAVGVLGVGPSDWSDTAKDLFGLLPFLVLSGLAGGGVLVLKLLDRR